MTRQERKEFIPIKIVYEPVYNENIPVPCFFTDQIYLAYRSYVGRFEKRKELISIELSGNATTVKISLLRMTSLWKNMSICAAREGITYSFDNDQLIFSGLLKIFG